MADNQVTSILSEYPAINDLLGKVVEDVRTFAEEQVHRIQELVRIGVALSVEKDLDALLELIVEKARWFTNADGGALYIRDEAGDRLDFAIVQNDTLKVRMGGRGEPITWPSVAMRDELGSENHRHVSAHCALTGKAVNIPDVYNAEGFDFEGTKRFDESTGYRSTSMVVIPMRDHENEVVGVLQLLNARARATGEVIPFPGHEVDMITSLASQAGIAITNVRLIQGLEGLLASFVKAIAGAIDEKSPYTGGHIMRVAELAETLARAVDKERSGRLGPARFSEDEIAELRMAAWLHDVGKITTPEYVVDKATKLETVFDRIETIRYRIEILKRDLELARLKGGRDAGGTAGEAEASRAGLALEEVEEALAFLEEVNRGSEFLPDESVARIRDLAGWRLAVDGREIPLLADQDVHNLSVRKGTITGEEREIINNHVRVTLKMLESLPFPRKLRNVPRFAGMHHEKLDGSGYPKGLSGEEIPIQGRILAIADIFEALTAADRPYKAGKRLSEALRILGFMVEDGHIDRDLCDLLVTSGVAADYAARHLPPRQRDAFIWQGQEYPAP